VSPFGICSITMTGLLRGGSEVKRLSGAMKALQIVGWTISLAERPQRR
jgi:hypothetical protein